MLAVGSDLDGMMTQNWRQPQPPRSSRSTSTPPTRRRTTRADVRRRAATRATACERCSRARAARTREPVGRPRARCASARWARLRAEHPAEIALPRRVRRGACPTRRSSSPTCASPATGSAGLGRVPAPRRLQYPMGWGTLGYAFPPSLGAALRRRAARSSRSPATAASSSPAASWPPSAQERLPLTARDRRRRRLRDAALRPAARGRRALRRRPAHAGLRRAGARASGCAPRRSTGLGDAFAAALAAPRRRPRADGARRARGAAAAADDLAALVPPGRARA